MFYFDVACSTENCSANGYVINVPNPQEVPLVFCGTCNQQISNIVKTEYREGE